MAIGQAAVAAAALAARNYVNVRELSYQKLTDYLRQYGTIVPNHTWGGMQGGETLDGIMDYG
ncbi:hypothetical protein [Paenibacillus sp. MY03]|uniref:hypothetical protein n=1 Tax=Paenibacillus sp. MY03 TaxID=302980 RepID=UPI00117F0061|nr:hypothetical protein [Paenibacillus sp. MY03]